MADNLHRIIKNIEGKWLVILTESCKKQFQECHLPSHDHTHHIRVWNYSKYLLNQLDSSIIIHEEDIERLIISVFFHDQGMSLTSSRDHGKISRQLCKSFFEALQIPIPHFDSVLDAIEKHDDKNYLTNVSAGKFHLLTVLNIADDMDAFGIIGVYRYLEIYLLRKISIFELPEKISDNLRNRYQHLIACFAKNKTFINSQTRRYIASRGFFKDLELQLKQVEYKPELYLGPIGIVNFINNEILIKGNSFHSALTEAQSMNGDFYFDHFFKKLEEEYFK